MKRATLIKRIIGITLLIHFIPLFLIIKKYVGCYDVSLLEVYLGGLIIDLFLLFIIGLLFLIIILLY